MLDVSVDCFLYLEVVVTNRGEDWSWLVVVISSGKSLVR